MGLNTDLRMEGPLFSLVIEGKEACLTMGPETIQAFQGLSKG